MAHSKVDTALVLEKANRLELLNQALSDELESSRRIMDHLGKSWEGEAYNQLTKSFLAFANKYFSSYQAMLKGYADYLRIYVDEGFTIAETENIAKSGDFEQV